MATPIKADELISAWSRGQFKSFYLFTGAEDFLIEEAVQRLTLHRLPGGLTDINRDRLDAERISAGQILQTCQTVPFSGDWRVVEVANVGTLSSEEQKMLAAGLKSVPSTTQCIFIWGKEWRRDDATRPLVESMLHLGSVVIFWPLFPEHARRWLAQRARHYNKTLSGEAAGWLVEEAGESLRRLDQELAKASAFVGGRPDIGREDLEASLGYGQALSPYAWLAAIRQRKSAASMQTLRRLLQEDEEPLKLLAMAQGSLKEWIIAKESGQMSGWRKDDAEALMDLKKRPVGELVDGLSFCVEAHQSIKTGKETPVMALTLLTLRLCGFQAADAMR